MGRAVLIATGMALAIWLSAAVLAVEPEPQPEPPAKQAGALAQEFVSLLRPRLKQAMAEGGPAGAIAVCADVAPAIADSLNDILDGLAGSLEAPRQVPNGPLREARMAAQAGRMQ